MNTETQTTAQRLLELAEAYGMIKADEDLLQSVAAKLEESLNDPPEGWERCEWEEVEAIWTNGRLIEVTINRGLAICTDSRFAYVRTLECTGCTPLRKIPVGPVVVVMDYANRNAFIGHIEGETRIHFNKPFKIRIEQ